MIPDRYGETFARFYDRYFGDYAEKAGPVLLRYFAPRSRSPGRVLDLGCGTGRVALRFLEAGYEVTGLDLSLEMLALAEQRCARFLIGGRARFVQGNMMDLKAPGPFEIVLSTYNSMNHLTSETELKSCFKSVSSCLANGGLFLFDYHTAKGLTEWGYSESADWEDGKLETSGAFDPLSGKAVMRLKGSYQGAVLDDSITNYTFPLVKLQEWLKESGFKKVSFAGMEDLSKTLLEPEGQKRIVVLAS